MKFHRIDHVGIVVNDFEAAKAFFLDFGFEVRWEGHMEGDWLGKLLKLDQVHTEFAVLGLPGAEAALEVIKYHAPPDENGIQPQFSNTLGIRHIAFAVDDLEAIVAKIKSKGLEIFSEIYNYENTYKLCYCRGPEGIILDLAEQITDNG